MKYLGSSAYFTRQRNADLMRVFRQKLAEATVVRMPEIFRQVAESPASRFWVSEERAAIVIAAMEAGRAIPEMIPSKREMFREIYRRYRELRRTHPLMDIIELASIIVNQPAPSFYFTPRSVGEIIYRIRRQPRVRKP